MTSESTNKKSLKVTRVIVYAVGLITSLPFLVTTFFVYACLQELRNIHGKSLMCYVAGLTGGYISLITINLAPFEEKSIGCIIAGYSMYFWFLVSFFWLNVMCFDIWRTFKGVRTKGSEKKKFIYYSLYGWSGPIVMLGFAIFMDFYDKVPIEVKPRFGSKKCFINGEINIVNRLLQYLLNILYF